jgi:hypothetical protein
MDTKADSPRNYSAHIIIKPVAGAPGKILYSLDTAKDAQPSLSDDLRGVVAYMMAKTGWVSVALPDSPRDRKALTRVTPKAMIPQGNLPYVDTSQYGRLHAMVLSTGV